MKKIILITMVIITLFSNVNANSNVKVAKPIDLQPSQFCIGINVFFVSTSLCWDLIAFNQDGVNIVLTEFKEELQDVNATIVDDILKYEGFSRNLKGFVFMSEKEQLIKLPKSEETYIIPKGKYKIDQDGKLNIKLQKIK